MAGRSSNCSADLGVLQGGRPARRPQGGDIRRARLGRSVRPQPDRRARVRAFGDAPFPSRLRRLGAVLRRRRSLRFGRAAGRIWAQRQARPAGPGADPGSGVIRSGGEGGGEGAEIARLHGGRNRLPGPRDCRDAGAARHSHDVRQLDLGGPGRRRRRAYDAGRMVERHLQRAALLFPAVPRPLALHRLGDAALADRLARAQAGRDPSGRQGRPGLSRRISERLFDVRVRR